MQCSKVQAWKRHISLPFILQRQNLITSHSQLQGAWEIRYQMGTLGPGNNASITGKGANGFGWTTSSFCHSNEYFI